MSVLPPEKRYPAFTREWCEEMAKRESDADFTAGVSNEAKLERIRVAFQALRDGKEHASSKLYRVLAGEFPPPSQSDAGAAQ
jgi:hypothetical protein